MIILVTGGGGPTGQAVSEHFRERGHTVIAVDRDDVDLLDRAAVQDLAARIEKEHGGVDGVVHLVGGWRGGKSFAETSLDDWDLLHDLLIRTLQHVSLAFEPHLRRSPDGRFVIVSAKAAERPTAGGAAYSAAKAAAEAWTLSLADALRGTGSAATILVVKALVNDAMRAANPEGRFPGFTDVRDLARAIGELYERPAGDVNGIRWDLTQ
ncbi:SDR family NAD(P)-dependent oxidoreductase [Nonomuraea muscovyensis]|uniref:NAD(P)-dependent dehydrogenase (Short-subunit alcohol dehydrogenase family) n=1 Tax=Nonomuraea muscovyensis TaxID=1124761 RepID=A0A7X0BWL7_9ACTN|nr:SDR family NAD(P)-dependent oxidoreductase [Nonomuraea muscovyensis]MBB6344274.1 NAD(P)-dependent dehydrogenase (short-subunit alcohol dehydrogenase family) [Nonomuraea muscovyensis]